MRVNIKHQFIVVARWLKVNVGPVWACSKPALAPCRDNELSEFHVSCFSCC